MVDANEGWTARQTLRNLGLFRQAGHEIFWVEDPVLRDDIDGLKLLRASAGPTLINSGEYLDASAKRLLMQAGATDMLNVHGHVTDVMRVGWLAADMGVPVTLGNSFLEVGVNMALALPEVQWVEYSFQNFEHLIERPLEIRDGLIWGSEAPGHGLVLSEAARRDWHRPDVLERAALGEAPIVSLAEGLKPREPGAKQECTAQRPTQLRQALQATEPLRRTRMPTVPRSALQATVPLRRTLMPTVPRSARHPSGRS